MTDIDCAVYVIQSVAWSLLGFVVGVVVARIRPGPHVTVYVTTTEATVSELEPASPRPPRRAWPRRVTMQGLIGAVVVVLALVSSIQGVVLQRQNVTQDAEDRRILTCQAAYANGFADALDARTTAALEAQTALDRVMDVVAESMRSGSPEARAAVQQSVDEYRDSRAKSKAAQQQNPYPPAPRDLCK